MFKNPLKLRISEAESFNASMGEYQLYLQELLNDMPEYSLAGIAKLMFIQARYTSALYRISDNVPALIDVIKPLTALAEIMQLEIIRFGSIHDDYERQQLFKNVTQELKEDIQTLLSIIKK